MKRWLQAPVAMTRWTLLAVALLLGLIAAGGLIAGSAALRHAATERERAIKAETLTKNDVVKIAQRIVEIQRPSRSELIRRVELALLACARDRKCAEALRAAASTGDSSSAGATRRLEPGSTRRTGPARRDASAPSPRRIARPPATRRRDRRDKSTGETSPPPGASDPSPADPAVAINTPALPEIGRPSLCTPVVGINC